MMVAQQVVCPALDEDWQATKGSPGVHLQLALQRFLAEAVMPPLGISPWGVVQVVSVQGHAQASGGVAWCLTRSQTLPHSTHE